MNDRLRCFCEAQDLTGAVGWLTETRRRLHRHPELSFQEADTAALVAERLQAWGWQVTTGVGGHGVVGTMKQGSGPSPSRCAPTWTPCPFRRPPASPGRACTTA